MLSAALLSLENSTKKENDRKSWIKPLEPISLMDMCLTEMMLDETLQET